MVTDTKKSRFNEYLTIFLIIDLGCFFGGMAFLTIQSAFWGGLFLMGIAGIAFPLFFMFTQISILFRMEEKLDDIHAVLMRLQQPPPPQQ